jgi:hypothetical protein
VRDWEIHESVDELCSIIASNQMPARALHCHDDQPQCAALLEKR